MAQLDRFLSVLVTNHGTALHLASDEVGTLEIDGTLRPITKQPFTVAQLSALVREIATPEAARCLDDDRDAMFSYTCAQGTFAVTARLAEGRLVTTIVPHEPVSSNGEKRASGAVVVTSRVDTVKTPGKPDQVYKIAGVFIVKGGKITEWTDFLAA